MDVSLLLFPSLPFSLKIKKENLNKTKTTSVLRADPCMGDLGCTSTLLSSRPLQGANAGPVHSFI